MCVLFAGCCPFVFDYCCIKSSVVAQNCWFNSTVPGSRYLYPASGSALRALDIAGNERPHQYSFGCPKPRCLYGRCSDANWKRITLFVETRLPSRPPFLTVALVAGAGRHCFGRNNRHAGQDRSFASFFRRVHHNLEVRL